MTWARECEHCRGPIPDSRNADAMYCCKKCKNAAYQANISAALLEAKAGRWCEWCGDPFPATKKAGCRFCSVKCQRAARYSAGIEARPVQTCPACGKGFRATRHDGKQVYCSRLCAEAAYLRPTPITCHQCGNTVSTPRQRQKFCNILCQGRWHRQKRRKG